MMNPICEIITIGDEILIGQTIDTNSAWIGENMSRIGLPVKRIISISDQPAEIQSALADSMKRADVVLITGGLGPTSDDRTKNTLCEFFGAELVENQDVLENISRIFKLRNYALTPVNRAQAMVPDNCTVLANLQGTAPGMLWEKEGTVVVSMPGVPFEMKSIMESSVFPLLTGRIKVPSILHKTIMTTGIGESMLAAMLEDWESKLPSNFSLAYLPSPGTVKVRISGTGENREVLTRQLAELNDSLVEVVREYQYGFDEITLEEVVGQLLSGKNLSLSTAESCTGGFISHLITRVPGSSLYYKGSIIAYANEIKTRQLHVSVDLLNDFGAVSREVVEQMAVSCRINFETDFAVATSGIAGPDGGTPTKPVGTIWIAVAGRDKVVSQCFQLGEHRERNILRASQAALNMLRIAILKDATE